MAEAFTPLRAEAPRDTTFRPAHRAPEPRVEPVPDPAAEAAEQAAAAAAEARADGYAAGLEAGRRAAEAAGQERIAHALEDMTAALATAGAEADRATRAATSELAALTVAMIEAAAPGLVARAAPGLMERLGETLRPRLGLMPAPRIAVAPGQATLLAPALTGRAVELTEDPALSPGDARVAWIGGTLRLSRAERLAALRAALAEAGLELEEG